MHCSMHQQILSTQGFIWANIVRRRISKTSELNSFGLIYVWLIFSEYRYMGHVVTVPDPCYRYCVGTRRKSLLTQTQVDDCAKVLEHQDIPQFETRMVAEVKLYWIIYTQCCASRLNLHNIRISLDSWKRDWAVLFGK